MQTADAVEAALGWTLKPEGLCRDDVCVLVPDRAALLGDASPDASPDAGPDGETLDVRVLGALLDRPVVVDDDSGVVAVGLPRAARRSALQDRKAPDFTLPDLDATQHSLADHRSKKRLLVAFSTW